MLLCLQDIQLHVGIAQQVDTIALRDIFLQVIHRIMDICRRVGLIIRAVGILHGDSGIHGQSRVEQAVVTPVLMYLTARERGIKLQTIIQHTLLAHKTGTILLAATHDVETITFLIIGRQTKVAVLGRAVDRYILV